MKLDEAIEALRAAWPEHGCGDHGCAVRKPQGMGTNGGCRCFRRTDFQDDPTLAGRVRCLIDAARRVVEAPHEPPPSVDEALAVLLDRAWTQADGGDVALPLRESLARLLPRMRIAGPWRLLTRDSFVRRVAGGDAIAARYALAGDTNTRHWRGSLHASLGQPDALRRTYTAARNYCDKKLIAAGWVLL